jgi:hypothetical protein
MLGFRVLRRRFTEITTIRDWIVQKAGRSHPCNACESRKEMDREAVERKTSQKPKHKAKLLDHLRRRRRRSVITYGDGGQDALGEEDGEDARGDGASKPPEEVVTEGRGRWKA